MAVAAPPSGLHVSRRLPKIEDALISGLPDLNRPAPPLRLASFA
jgi:hypothetical protein